MFRANATSFRLVQNVFLYLWPVSKYFRTEKVYLSLLFLFTIFNNTLQSFENHACVVSQWHDQKHQPTTSLCPLPDTVQPNHNLSRELVLAFLASSSCWLTGSHYLVFQLFPPCWMPKWFLIHSIIKSFAKHHCLRSSAFFCSLPKPAIISFRRPEQRWHHRRGHHPCISDLRCERQAPLEDEGGNGQGSGRAGCAEADRGGSEERSPEAGGDGLKTGPGSGENGPLITR